MRIGVDPWPRIEFFVSHGLLEKRPTATQLQQAGRLNVYHAGLTERLRTFGGDPRKLLLSRARTWALRVSSQAIQAGVMQHGLVEGAQAYARLVPARGARDPRAALRSPLAGGAAVAALAVRGCLRVQSVWVVRAGQRRGRDRAYDAAQAADCPCPLDAASLWLMGCADHPGRRRGTRAARTRTRTCRHESGREVSPLPGDGPTGWVL